MTTRRGFNIHTLGVEPRGFDVRSTAAFNPRKLVGMVGWWRADKGLTLNGTKVATWADQSGRGNDLSQPTNANRPTLTNNALNGKPVVTFADASATWMTSTSADLAPTAAVTMVAVARYTTQQTVSFIGGRGDTGSAGYWLGYENTTAEGDIGNGTTDVRPNNGTISANVWAVLSLVYDGSKATFYKSGLAGTALSLAGPIVYTANPNFYLGQTTSLIAGRGLTGDIAEVYVFNRALAGADLFHLQHYLGTLYNLSIAG